MVKSYPGGYRRDKQKSIRTALLESLFIAADKEPEGRAHLSLVTCKMDPMPRTPQDKKRFSYTKDRRNVYGANDKASRKGLPLKKKRASRSYRRRANAPLVHTSTELDSDVVVEQRLGSGYRYVVGSKMPDKPLGEVLIHKLESRARRGMNQTKATQAKLKQISRKIGKP
jgi:hypothetical protein